MPARGQQALLLTPDVRVDDGLCIAVAPGSARTSTTNNQGTRGVRRHWNALRSGCVRVLPVRPPARRRQGLLWAPPGYSDELRGHAPWHVRHETRGRGLSAFWNGTPSLDSRSHPS